MSSSTISWPVRRDTIEEGAGYSPAVFLRTGSGASLGQGQISSWTLKVYNRQSVSEDTAVYSSGNHSPFETNTDGSFILRTSPATDGWAPNPTGYTFRPDLDPTALWGAAGGDTYALEFTFQSSFNHTFQGAAILRCELSVVPKFS